jgi:hypothetical protein
MEFVFIILHEVSQVRMIAINRTLREAKSALSPIFFEKYTDCSGDEDGFAGCLSLTLFNLTDKLQNAINNTIREFSRVLIASLESSKVEISCKGSTLSNRDLDVLFNTRNFIYFDRVEVSKTYTVTCPEEGDHSFCSPFRNLPLPVMILGQSAIRGFRNGPRYFLNLIIFIVVCFIGYKIMFQSAL